MQCNTKEDKAKMTKRVAEKALPFSVPHCSIRHSIQFGTISVSWLINNVEKKLFALFFHENPVFS